MAPPRLGEAGPSGVRAAQHPDLGGGLSIKDDAVEDRAELNQGEDFPPRDRLPAPQSADRQVAHLSTVVPVLRACYESRCGD
jgi:hypothetical protein